MIASRTPRRSKPAANNTTCPPRRSFVAGDARRRGQVCIPAPQPHAAFGAALPTPAMLAGVDNTVGFTLMPDS